MFGTVITWAVASGIKAPREVKKKNCGGVVVPVYVGVGRSTVTIEPGLPGGAVMSVQAILNPSVKNTSELVLAKRAFRNNYAQQTETIFFI